MTCKKCIHYDVCGDRQMYEEDTITSCPDFINKGVEVAEITLAHIIGIMAMVSGFISMLTQNNFGAYACFGYAFILWVVIAIDTYKQTKERRDT